MSYYFLRWHGYSLNELVLITALVFAMFGSVLLVAWISDKIKLKKKRKELLDKYFISKDIMDKRL